MDSGPIIKGFLDLRNPSGGILDIQHGVDLSHHNKQVNYSELSRCGADFAIIKMDNHFINHFQQLNLHGIPVVPYHYLSVAANNRLDYKKRPEIFSAPNGTALSESALRNLLNIAEVMGREKAKFFVAEYLARMPEQNRTFSLAGLNGQIVAVDVEEYFNGKSTLVQRQAFGRFYAAMLASWIREVRSRLFDIKIIFYTFPDIYTSYLQFALPDANAIINAMPVWLARTRATGEDFDLKSEQNLQRICWSNNVGNRCILHQYSHRGVFAVNSRPSQNPPAHIDVNRLFVAKEVANGVGQQIVRRDD
jgi:hypothetical protein